MQVKDICRVVDTDAYCRIDDIKGDTAKVYFGRDAGGAYWDRLPLSVLQGTDRDSYGLPSWFKVGQHLDGGVTIVSIGRTYATLRFDDGEEVEKKKRRRKETGESRDCRSHIGGHAHAVVCRHEGAG